MPTMSSTVRFRGTTLQKKHPHDSINRQRSNGHTLKTHCTVKLVEQQSWQHPEPNDFGVSSQTAITAHSSGSPSLCEAYLPILFFPSKLSLSSKTAALRMGLSHAKISKSHGIALLRLTLFFSCILLVLCLHSEQLMAKGQFVSDCKSTPSLRNGNPHSIVNEVRRFVDNCIKTKDGIRFRKRFPASIRMDMNDFNDYGPTEAATPIELMPHSTLGPFENMKGIEDLAPNGVAIKSSSSNKIKLVPRFKEKRYGQPPSMLLAAYIRDMIMRRGQKLSQQDSENWADNFLTGDQ